MKGLSGLISLKTFVMPFSTKGNPTQALRRAYITAFTVIAILTFFTHFFTSFITAKQQESTELLFMMSRQSNLIQQVIFDGYNYINSEAEIDQGFLKQTVQDLSGSHGTIIRFVEGRGDYSQSESLHEIYFEQPFMLNEKIRDFIQSAESMASYPPDQMASIKRTVMGNLIEKRTRLLPLIDMANERYQTETAGVINRNYYFQLLAVSFIIIVLLLEALFIFRPLVARINSYHKLLIRQAMEDPLTGLSNRRSFMKQSVKEIAQARRKESNICVALCDLDHFKSVNDVYGHEVGDRVLKHFSSLLKETLRAGDIIGRIGGEEFAIILSNDTGATTGQKVLDRLVEKVANTPCPYVDDKGQEQELTYTTSVGFCAKGHKHNLDIDALMKIADDALYEAKEGGRNRAVYFDLEENMPHAGGAGGNNDDSGSADNASEKEEKRNKEDGQKKGPETLISGQTAVIEGV